MITVPGKIPVAQLGKKFTSVYEMRDSGIEKRIATG